MPDHILIYVIVLLNAVCQALLIWRFKIHKSQKWAFCGLTIGVPVMIALFVRTLVAFGILHSSVVDQVGFERFITMAASMLLIGGPWIVTTAAVVLRMKQGMITAS